MVDSVECKPSWDTKLEAEKSLVSLPELWAKKYVEQLYQQQQSLDLGGEIQPRSAIAQQLVDRLRSVSAQSWNKTEALLANEMRRHQIESRLIDPWAIAKDVHFVYEKVLQVYANRATPQSLSVLISSDLGRIRHKYTRQDPRLIGFVSMQFHYCGQLLMSQLEASEQSVIEEYFKVIDDHLYMPLQRAYQAAAQCEFNDPRLKTVQRLLPVSSQIACEIVATVNQLYPSYACYSGPLNSKVVRASSIRDVEMFQIYLWICVLEKNISAITQELFPLCVMLYPTLKVNWELVRQMISLLGKAFEQHIHPQQSQYYQPYYQVLWKMFSPEVFPDTIA
ncbi:hypothetical protein [Almyronema epifaneia]|uniref:Phycobilisome protein n=1 Tax=Almyronema epifaneia S1 TaxID=2991925 RepID=A0ABW6IAM1_9CYAN